MVLILVAKNVSSKPMKKYGSYLVSYLLDESNLPEITIKRIKQTIYRYCRLYPQLAEDIIAHSCYLILEKNEGNKLNYVTSQLKLYCSKHYYMTNPRLKNKKSIVPIGFYEKAVYTSFYIMDHKFTDLQKDIAKLIQQDYKKKEICEKLSLSFERLTLELDLMWNKLQTEERPST